MFLWLTMQRYYTRVTTVCQQLKLYWNFEHKDTKSIRIFNAKTQRREEYWNFERKGIKNIRILNAKTF